VIDRTDGSGAVAAEYPPAGDRELTARSSLMVVIDRLGPVGASRRHRDER
jgi:hypothetical protein